MPYTKVKRGRKGESPIELQKICKSVIETKYFKNLTTLPVGECQKLVAFNYYNLDLNVQPSKLKILINRVNSFLHNKKKEVFAELSKDFDGPYLVIPKSFNIQFKFHEIFLVKDIFDKDLTVNINRTFSKINNLCNIVVYSKYTKESYSLAIINFKCCYKGCPATYKFSLINSNLVSDTDLVLKVDQTGNILHNKVFQKQFKKKLVLKNLSVEDKMKLREQLSEAKNPSQVYYSLLEKRRLEELSGKHTEKAKKSDFISKKQLCSLKSDHLKKVYIEFKNIIQLYFAVILVYCL